MKCFFKKIVIACELNLSDWQPTSTFTVRWATRSVLAIRFSPRHLYTVGQK